MAQGNKFEFFANTVKDLYKDLGYSKVRVTFDNLGRQLSVNYCGDIIKVTVEGVKDGIEETKKLVIKAVPDDFILRMKTKLDRKFHTEVCVYNKILPLMDEIQKRFNVKDTINHCKVLKVHAEEFKEMILMEDLSENGFEQSRVGRNITDFDHAANVVEKIGKLHALSFALEKYSPGVLEENLSSTDDIINDKASPFFANYALKIAIKNVKDPIAQKRVSDLLGTDSSEYMKSMLGSKIAAPYAVLAHSDIWTNNIMFKYEGNKVVDAIFLDWQLVRHHSPAVDLLFFLFSSVDDDIRSPNFQTFLELYYETLAGFLEELGCDPREIFPVEAYREQLKKFTKFTLAIVIFVIQIFVGHGFDLTAIDFDDFENSPGLFVPDEAYIKRLNSIITDLIEHGLL